MFWRHHTRAFARIEAQLDRIEARLITLSQRMDAMSDDFTALTQTVNDIGDAVTATAARVQADFAALQTAQQSNDQPAIDALTAKLQDSLTHLNAIGEAASSATPDTPVEVPSPPASIADPSDPTAVDTSTTAS